MGYLYSELTDRAKIAQIVGTNYANMAKVIQSGLVSYEGNISQGTTEEWIREKLFQGDSDGQTIGVNSEITLSRKIQTLYKMPVCYRADGALLDEIWEDISVKEAKRMAETNLVNGISEKSAQIVDSVFVHILNGWAKYAVANTMNYLDKNGSQISPVIVQEAKAKRFDQGQYDNGIMICRSLTYFKMGALGMAAYTSNVMGAAEQDSLVSKGRLVNDTILGMQVLITDKLKNQGGTITETASYDHYTILAEKGALIGKNGGAPDIRPIQEKERGFQEIVKFKIKVGGTVRGMSWAGSVGGDGEITDTNLETAASWTTATGTGLEKYIPLVAIRTDYPSF